MFASSKIISLTQQSLTITHVFVPVQQPEEQNSEEFIQSHELFLDKNLMIDCLRRMKESLLLKSRSNQNASRLRISEQCTYEQVQTIASILPDEVIHNAAFDYEFRTFDAAVIFADISGFTDLSDKYQSVENGASKLSMVLNFYLGE